MPTIETSQEIDTPEGIAISVSMAGPLTRGFAWCIDTMIFSIAIVILNMIFSMMAEFGQGILLILTFFLYWFYPVVFEVLNHGTTPGKKAMGLKVLHVDGTPIGWAASINRNLLRVVDFLPFMYGTGLVAMLLNKKFQRLGDIVAGTLVVYERRSKELPETDDIPPTPPKHPLTIEEQRAILGFAERSKAISTERREELARMTGALVQNQDSATQHLLGIANWIKGRNT